MKYKYYMKNGNLLAESDSSIKFNTKLFPAFGDIEPVIEKDGKRKAKPKVDQLDENNEGEK
jgi:hypothetical protein